MATGSCSNRGCTAVFCVFAAATIASCSTGRSTIRIVDHDAEGGRTRLRETFNEAYYRYDGQGNVDVVLRRVEPGTRDAGGLITQLLHIHSVWESTPGKTIAERTQINATVRYQILTGAGESTYQGGGSIFLIPKGDRLDGEIEYVTLSPVASSALVAGLFEQAELSGSFTAVQDGRRVVRWTNEMATRAARAKLARR